MSKPNFKVTYESQEDNRSIFREGNFVVNDAGLILLVVKDDGPHSCMTVFSGVVIGEQRHFSDGIFSNVWQKKAFRQFHGTITITV